MNGVTDVNTIPDWVLAAAESEWTQYNERADKYRTPRMSRVEWLRAISKQATEIFLAESLAAMCLAIETVQTELR